MSGLLFEWKMADKEAVIGKIAICADKSKAAAGLTACGGFVHNSINCAGIFTIPPRFLLRKCLPAFLQFSDIAAWPGYP